MLRTLLHYHECTRHSCGLELLCTLRSSVLAQSSEHGLQLRVLGLHQRRLKFLVVLIELHVT
jgi:hypothetical protein